LWIGAGASEKTTWHLQGLIRGQESLPMREAGGCFEQIDQSSPQQGALRGEAANMLGFIGYLEDFEEISVCPTPLQRAA
jgi:hypothetical protein